MPTFDFHMHSNVSRDGEFTPKQLIAMAKAKGLTHIALCDHNDNRGIDTMIDEGKKHGITVIPAIEFDTTFEGYEVHLLGYNFNYKDEYFNTLAQTINTIMDDAMHERIVTFEKNYGITLDEEKIMRDTPEGDNPFFTLCDTMLNDPKHAHIEDFQDYLPGGKRDNPQVVNFYWDKCAKGTKNFVTVNYPDFKATVDIIHQHGGIAILAHPFKTFYHNETLLQKAIDAGIDGIEAYSNYHDADMNAYYDEYASSHNLLMSCGSDFHGKLKPAIKMGEYGYTKDDGNTILTTFLHTINKWK